MAGLETVPYIFQASKCLITIWNRQKKYVQTQSLRKISVAKVGKTRLDPIATSARSYVNVLI